MNECSECEYRNGAHSDICSLRTKITTDNEQSLEETCFADVYTNIVNKHPEYDQVTIAETVWLRCQYHNSTHYEAKLAEKDAEIAQLEAGMKGKRELVEYWHRETVKLEEHNATDRIVIGQHQAHKRVLNDRIAELDVQLKQTLDAFRHNHVHWEYHNDICKQCGLDLRNPVHAQLLTHPPEPQEE